MALGPILIFDKSTLQGLNPDEAMWLDNFFMTNITPLFFVETLADLEKEVRSGRTPEQVVGNLAYKTPDMQSRANVHQATLLAGELTGAAEVEVRYGRPIISGGQPVALEGKTGIVFQTAPEEEALARWQRGEFLEIERLIAKAWRRALSNIDFQEIYRRFRERFIDKDKPKTLHEVKLLSDAVIDGPDPENIFRFGLSLLGVPKDSQEQVITRWQVGGRRPIREFAPYFTHIFSVDLFFYLAIAADLIARTKRTNKVDFAYLYYLPFCMVFASSDNLHSAVVPHFLRADQSFIKGTDLKADLAKLDQYYSALPPETKRRGVFHFAKYPPSDSSFLVTQLWDKHCPLWRKHDAVTQKPVERDEEERIVREINRLDKMSAPVEPATPIASDDADYILIKRQVLLTKGKWRRFPPEVEKTGDNEP